MSSAPQPALPDPEHQAEPDVPAAQPVEEMSAMAAPAAEDRPLAGEPGRTSFFEHYASHVAPPRIPNIFDVFLFAILMLIGGLCAFAITGLALRAHMFGVHTQAEALQDIHYTLGSQELWYVVTFAGALMLFPAVWHVPFFEGVAWRASAVWQMRWRLTAAVLLCFLAAMVDGMLVPGPTNAPIDQIFRLPGAAWALFAFGVTLAPFFEELGFRGFLLPALCTAWDWCAERIQHRPAPWPDAEGNVPWSLPAMIAGSILTSIPFALIHAEQTGYSVGPFALLVCVSLALCWIRLSTRSLAASTLVHACYNLLLFSLMLAGTGGFRHLDRL